MQKQGDFDPFAFINLFGLQLTKRITKFVDENTGDSPGGKDMEDSDRHFREKPEYSIHTFTITDTP